MALGDGIGRNKDVAHWKESRQRDYYTGAREFIEWLLSNDKYSACEIDADENLIVSNVGLVKDRWTINAKELIEEFERKNGEKNES